MPDDIRPAADCKLSALVSVTSGCGPLSPFRHTTGFSGPVQVISGPQDVIKGQQNLIAGFERKGRALVNPCQQEGLLCRFQHCRHQYR
jgi:hypothetical protein